MDHEVRDARSEDLMHIAKHMRMCDRKEIAAVSGCTPLEALKLGMDVEPNSPSQFVKAVIVQGVPLLAFGVRPSAADERIGIVWMLATDFLDDPKCKRILARNSRKWVADIQAHYELLANQADKRNASHHRWLKWCGFTFINEVAVGPLGVPFLEFVRMKPCVT